MVQPVSLSVDNDPAVLRGRVRPAPAVRRAYRIVRADSGAKALAALEGLRRRGDLVALLLVDQRMPHGC